MGLGGLFAGGMPKLRPVGSSSDHSVSGLSVLSFFYFWGVFTYLNHQVSFNGVLFAELMLNHAVMILHFC